MLEITRELLKTKEAPEVMQMLMNTGLSSLEAATLVVKALGPVAEPVKNGKVQMEKVVILWSEGLADEDVTFTSWEEVNQTLRQIAQEHDKNGYTGAYAKTKFQVYWADGETYEGRLDVNTKYDYDLGQHILDHCRSHGGIQKPEQWTEAEYQRYINEVGNPQDYLDYMEKYDIQVSGVELVPTPKPEPKPQASVEVQNLPQGYVPGAIIEHSWGYDQTNIDYYLITKRTDKGYLYLQAIGSHSTGSWSGTCTPDPTNVLDKPVVRRRVITDREGKEIGVGSPNGHGWADLWDGKPGHWTTD